MSTCPICVGLKIPTMNGPGSWCMEASERIMWDALRRRPPERLNSCSKIRCLTNSINSIFSCRRQSRRRRFNGSQQSGKRWAILQIGATLLPRVLHPTHHRAGDRLPPDHHHRYAPVSRARFSRSGHPPRDIRRCENDWQRKIFSIRVLCIVP